MNFFEFAEMVSKPQEVLRYVRRKGLLLNYANCSRCGWRMSDQSSCQSIDGLVFRRTKCKSKESIRSSSFFENSKLELRVVASIVYLLSAEVLQLTIAEILDLDRGTVSDFANLLREEMGQKLMRDEERLGGPGIIVQVYSYFYTRSTKALSQRQSARGTCMHAQFARNGFLGSLIRKRELGT
jgi:hypothetical protein